MAAVTYYGPSGDPYVDGVLWYYKWASNDLSYSFPAQAAFYGSNYGYGEPANNFEPLNDIQTAAVRAALSNIESSVDLTFNEVTESSTVHGTLRYAMSDEPWTAYAYLPHPAPEGGDSWYNNESQIYDVPIKGNYAYLTFVHETGHALGLSHAHEDYVMPIGRDSMEYTVMSYRSYVGASLYQGYTNEKYGFAQTLMMYDIAALQYVYGANYNSNSGDSVYSWSPSSGEMFIDGAGQGAPGANRVFMTVWDGGGTDTYDLSNYATGVEIDLRPGQWTTTSATQLAKLHRNGSEIAVGNIANALLYGGNWLSLIENAKGGSGHDYIIGNQTSNILWGNEGNDVLSGGNGHDVLIGGAGADILLGGYGHDMAHYGGAPAGLTADLIYYGTNTGEAAGDRYVNIQALRGSDFGDMLRGDNLGNVLIGAGGNDVLFGRGGNDSLLGGDGDDALVGGAGADFLSGGDGFDLASYGAAPSRVVADLLYPGFNTGEAAGDRYDSIEGLLGSRFDDSLRGDDLGNLIHGAGGNDALYGRGGDDTLIGGPGADLLHGGVGFDTASYGGASAGVVVHMVYPGANTGDAAGDSYVSIETLAGSSFGDSLFGDNLDNVIDGAAGNDALYGLGGDDTLIGGTGADYLDGGEGFDTASYGTAAARVVADLAFPSTNTGDAAGDSYVSIEALSGSGFADSLFGDDLDNLLDGGEGNDILYGRGGDDTLIGGSGADTLVGGAGADALYGGAGADIFLFEASADSVPGGYDTIMDFLSGVDMIDLRLIDANAGLDGDQAFNFIGGNDFAGTAGELMFLSGFLSGDTNGDMQANFEIYFVGVDTLYESDFFL
jgi:serralysin